MQPSDTCTCDTNSDQWLTNLLPELAKSVFYISNSAGDPKQELSLDYAELCLHNWTKALSARPEGASGKDDRGG